MNAAVNTWKHFVKGYVDAIACRGWGAASVLLLRGFEPASDLSGLPVIVFASPGGRNVGDQALLEAAVGGASGDVVVVVRDRTSYQYDGFADSSRIIEVVELPFLHFTIGPRRWQDLRTLRGLLSRASAAWVIGADVMDGGYSERGSLHTWYLMRSMALTRFPVRVLGFSWKARVSMPVRRAARRAAQAGVINFLRDPVSKARFDISTGTIGVESADIVFTHREVAALPRSADTLTEFIRRAGPLSLLNISALVGSKIDQREEVKRIALALLDSGHSVLVLPHVQSDSADDYQEALRTVGDIDHPQLLIHGTLLAPAQEAWIIRHARLVVTGRMHLSILGMKAGVPSMVLATQGKVEGLMRLVGHPEWAVEPSPGFGERVVSVLESGSFRGGDRDERFSQTLSRIKQLAERNFAFNPDPGAHPDELVIAENSAIGEGGAR